MSVTVIVVGTGVGVGIGVGVDVGSGIGVGVGVCVGVAVGEGLGVAVGVGVGEGLGVGVGVGVAFPSTKTYAEPCTGFGPTLAKGDPTMAVPPEIATPVPKLSNSAPSEAVSFGCWPHDVPERRKIYAEP